MEKIGLPAENFENITFEVENAIASITVGNGINLGAPVTSDNCGIASVTNNAPSCFPLGVTPVTWKVTDIAGNFSTCIQNVTVQDNIVPVAIAKNITIQFRKIKIELLYNKEGLEEKDGYFIAGRERAFLDTIFLYKDFYCDNLKPLDWDKISKLSDIFQSQSLEKRIAAIFKNFKNEI